MSADFPKRCCDLLTRLQDEAIRSDRDVTLMLTVATAGFVIPYERLRPRNADHPHPSGDRVRFDDASRSLDTELEKKLAVSDFSGSETSSWRWSDWQWYTPIPESKLADGNIDSALTVPYVSLPETLTLEAFLNHVRNALAHGNVYTYGHPSIQRIHFLSKPYLRADYHDVLLAPPGTFRAFLLSWFDFLKGLRFPDYAQPVYTLDLPIEATQEVSVDSEDEEAEDSE
jgi:hypothetical protein